MAAKKGNFNFSMHFTRCRPRVNDLGQVGCVALVKDGTKLNFVLARDHGFREEDVKSFRDVTEDFEELAVLIKAGAVVCLIPVSEPKVL